MRFTCVVIAVLVCLLLLVELIKIKMVLRKIVVGNMPETTPIFITPELQKLDQMTRDLTEKVDQETVYRDIQLRTLVNQINPHFLYNTLESIRGQAIISNAFVVADMTETLSHFFRYCITQKGTVVSIEEEVKNVTLYLKIINFRMAGRFDFVEIIEDKSVLEREIPKLTVQPIIENAIQHGLYDKKNGTISLRIIRTNGGILIYVHDNGTGMSQKKLEELNQSVVSPHDPTRKYEGGALLYKTLISAFGFCMVPTMGFIFTAQKE